MTSYSKGSSTKKYLERKSADKFFLLLSLCVFLVVFVWFTSNVLKKYLNIGEVRVPDLHGIQFEEAEKILQKINLNINVYPENSPEHAFNSVVSQTPAPYAIVRQGRKVSLGINSPPQEVIVPEIVGLLQDEAILLLESLNLSLGELSYDNSDLPQGTIISTDSPAQSVLSGGSSINVVVSRGPSSEKFIMPQLIGLQLQDAKGRLQALGIRRIETAINTVNRSRLGTVTGQHPEAGRDIFSSSTVTLYHTLSDPNVVAVPNVIGLTVQEAQRRLQNAGLDVRSQWLQYRTDPNRAQGVVEQRPTGYTLVGTPVALIINGLPTGVNSLYTPYNNQSDAVASIDAPPPPQPIGSAPLGSPINSVPPSTLPPPDPYDTSVSSSPTPSQPQPITELALQPSNNSSLSPTTTVPSPPLAASNSRSIPIIFDPASYGFLQGQTNEYRLVVIDDRGERDEIRQTLQVGESINTYVTVYGQAELRTYVNDSFFQAWNP